MPYINCKYQSFLDADGYSDESVDNICLDIINHLKDNECGYEIVSRSPNITIFHNYIKGECYQIIYYELFDNFVLFDSRCSRYVCLFNDYFSEAREKLHIMMRKKLYEANNPLDISLTNLEKLDVESVEFVDSHSRNNHPLLVEEKYYDLNDFMDKLATAIYSKPDYKKHMIKDEKLGTASFNVVVNGNNNLVFKLVVPSGNMRSFAELRFASNLVYQGFRFVLYNKNTEEPINPFE